MTPRVGSAAWTAARLAWRDVATASARALIARRVDGLRRDSLEASTFLEAGTHEVPRAEQAEPNAAWPPGRDRESPELAAAHHRQRHRRHVVDGVWPAERCGALASSAASALAPLRDRHGEASVAALGFASRDILGDASFADMRDALSAMRREAERAFSFGARGFSEPRLTEKENGKGKARRLYPVGALLTHIVPAADATRTRMSAGTRGDAGTQTSTRRETRYSYAAAGTGYWSPHVDKANVPEYDVSAILYLSDGKVQESVSPPGATSVDRECRSGARGRGDFEAEFSGGTLVFLDAFFDDERKRRRGEDDPDDAEKRKRNNANAQTVCVGITPRRGRLVVFASGEENVHAVSVVETGARATLNLWLTADKRVGADEQVFDRELWRGDDAEA